MTDARPVSLLIAALGGEGGGVLTDWIVSAAQACDLPVQSTSIPGVAQRTGATTYYIEIFPVPNRDLGGRRPVLALSPGAGDVDMVVASELLEAGRQITLGFVTPDRTLLIASTSRVYLTLEKMQMGDGRHDSARLIEAAAQSAKAHVLFDMESAAKAAGAIVNSVMLGAIAASGRLPVPAAALEAAIRHDGKAVESNLRGFRAGFEAIGANPPAPQPLPGKRGASGSLDGLEAKIADLPEAARALAAEGARRLVGYQDARYAHEYLDILNALARTDARTNAGGALAAAVARHLAVRMSYEDVIRVAQVKISPERFRRIEGEIGAKGEPYVITEFLKPGIEELCQVLPVRLAERIMAYSKRRGLIDTVHFAMEVNTTSVFGYLRFWTLAKLRRWRPKGWRYDQEQRAIKWWLMQIEAAAKLSPELALEVTECARLIKGYGDTWKRGRKNYETIIARVLTPALEGRIPLRVAIDGIASARTAALADPDGESLAATLAAIEARAALRQAAE